MSRRVLLENGEDFVISVTPIPRGILWPVITLIILESLVVKLAWISSAVREHEGVALVLVGALPALLVGTRVWRSRSHTITLTTQRIVSTRGVIARSETQVYLEEVTATHSRQSLGERLRRRGVVVLECSSREISLEAVRHPAALRRTIDRTRREDATSRSSPWQTWSRDADDESGGPIVNE